MHKRHNQVSVETKSTGSKFIIGFSRQMGCLDMNILLLGTNITTGGAQRVLLDLAGWLYQQDIPVTAAFIFDRDGLLPAWQKRFAFPVNCLNAWMQDDRPLRRAKRLLVGWFHLIKWMRRERFSAILTFTHDSNILGIPAAWLAGIPVRFGSHHVRYPSLSKIKILLHTWIMNSHIASGLVAVSGFTRTQAIEEGVNPERIHIVHNGIDILSLTANHPASVRDEILSEGEGPLVVSIGRLVPQKGQSYFVKGAAEVLKTYPRAVFCIAGDGPLKSELLNLIGALGISSQVRLLGNRQDIPDLLAACDLFVLTSLYEGLPMVLLEAMSAGAPVICTNIPGVTDVITNGETGLLVPSQNVMHLAEAICRVLSDDALRRKISQNGKTLVQESFSLTRMGQQYLKLLGSKDCR